MALSDEQILIVAMYVFTLGFLIALGMKRHPLFFILAGIIGVVLGIEMWNLTNTAMPNAATILSTIFIGVSSMLILFGFMSKSEPIKIGR